MAEQLDLEVATEERGLELVSCDGQAGKEARLVELPL